MPVLTCPEPGLLLVWPVPERLPESLHVPEKVPNFLPRAVCVLHDRFFQHFFIRRHRLGRLPGQARVVARRRACTKAGSREQGVGRRSQGGGGTVPVRHRHPRWRRGERDCRRKPLPEWRPSLSILGATLRFIKSSDRAGKGVTGGVKPWRRKETPTP